MASDNIRIMCPSLVCRKILAVPVSSRGKNVRCRNCGATIRIPEKSAVAAAPKPPEPQKPGAKTGAPESGAPAAKAA